MRIALIFNKTRPDTTGGYFEWACRTLDVGYDQYSLQDLTRMRRDYALYLRIDHGDDYAFAMPSDLKPVVFYAIDTHLSHSWRKIRRSASSYNIVFCAQAEAARNLANGEWLPLASDASIDSHDAYPQTWDVGFVGFDGGIPRKFYLQALRERYPNSFIGRAEHNKLRSIYGGSRVGFNYSIADDVNMRIFEILASNTLLVTNALNNDDLRALGMEDGRHLVLYRDPEELFHVIDEYLSQPERRKMIAQEGFKLVRAQHTYVHRMRQVLATVNKRLKMNLACNVGDV